MRPHYTLHAKERLSPSQMTWKRKIHVVACTKLGLVCCVCVWGGGGGVNEGNCGMGVRASISKPTQFIYLTLKKRTHSYTRSSEMLTHLYTALCFLYPFIAGSEINIAVNSLSTKRTSSLENSLNEKYVLVPRYIRKVGVFIY